ncbi:MAG: hypothetical protein AB7N76_13080 [Planctomycetota bacterium]
MWRPRRDAAWRASPFWLGALCFHLALLVGLSFWRIAARWHRDPPAIQVRIARRSPVLPPTQGADERARRATSPLLDDRVPELEAPSERDTGEAYREAQGGRPGREGSFGLGRAGGAGRGRGGAAERRGASVASGVALEGALEWLARHRTREGVWGSAGTGPHGSPSASPPALATTGLALLAFVSGGHDTVTPGPYRELVVQARDWLADAVGDDGRYRGQALGYAYDHAICTIALAEAFARDRRAPRVQAALERAASYILASQALGWRYSPREAGDTSVTSWMVLALRSCEAAGVHLPTSDHGPWPRARRFLEAVSGSDGRTGYTGRGNGTPGMDATGLFLRVLLGESPSTPRNRAATHLVAQTRIELDRGRIKNLYQLYYAALALYQVGGEPWLSFNLRVRDGLISLQRKGADCERGSWSGTGWISDTLLATCFGALILETYYRYLPAHAPGSVPVAAARAPAPRLDGTSLLEYAGVALDYARGQRDVAALEAAVEAHTRALRQLALEGAAWPLQERAHLGRIEAALALDRADEVEAWIEAYRRGLPRGARPAAAIAAIERANRCDQVWELLRRAERDPTLRARAEEAALGLERRLALEAQGDGAPATRRLREELRLRRLALVFVRDPDAALTRLGELASERPAEGPLGREERELLLQGLRRATRELAAGARLRDPARLEAGLAALGALEARHLLLRMDGRQRALLAELHEEALRGRVVALAQLGRDAEVAPAARAYAREFAAHRRAVDVEACERVALTRLVARGEADARARRRLVELVERHLRRDPATGASDRFEAARLCARLGERARARALAAELLARADPTGAARLFLAELALDEGDPRRALAQLDALPPGVAGRLDVRRARCRVQRVTGDPRAALVGYAELLRGLPREGPWWEVAYELAETYLEAGERERARAFLEELREADRDLGGDEALRARFLELMRRLDR